MEYKEEETLKFERTASGKYVYTIKLIGTVENNLARMKAMKLELNIMAEVK